MPDASRHISAQPTKEFFIDMLVRDIDLVDAILDLVDNSVDGASRLRGSSNYEGLRIELTVSENLFRISDNCGGMPVDLARNYAFRFGRPPGVPVTPHPIGMFGVGLKRAVFKMGDRFSVNSTTIQSKFVVAVNVNEWRESEEWAFKFDSLDEDILSEESKTGTVVEVTDLHVAVAEKFKLQFFYTRLASRVEFAHSANMRRGLDIAINGNTLQAKFAEVLYSKELKPASKQFEFYGDTNSPLRVRVVVGVGDSSPDNAGWYVLCNGRVVLRADKSPVTGWAVDEPASIPRFHNQFARFRGWVEFESDDAARLPWNTMKSGVDWDSEAFQKTRQQMILSMRGVIDFLNELDREIEEDEKPRHLAVKDASRVRADEVREAASFSFEAAPRPKKVRMGSVQYKKPEADLRHAMQVLGADSFKQVGEMTFDLFYEAKCND